MVVIALLLSAILLIIAISLSHHIKQKVKEVEPARPPGMGDPLEKAVLHPGLYSKVIYVTLSAVLALVFLSYGLWTTMLFQLGSLGFNLGVPVALVPAIYTALSIKKVDTDQRGSLYFYGIPLKNVGPGPQFIPFGLMNLVRRPIDIQRIIEPGEQDKIFWGDEKEPLPSGLVRPIFVIARSPKEDVGEVRRDAGKAPLDVQLQYGLSFFWFWGVSDDVATFVQNSRTIEEAREQIKAASLTLVNEIVSSRTAEGVIVGQEEVNRALVDAMCQKAVGMGIRIFDGGLQSFNLSHEMAAAMRDRAKAQFQAETKNIETDAEARQRREYGKADGDAAREREKGLLEGRAEGMKTMKEVLQVSGSEILASEVIREGWPKSTVIAGAGPGTADLAAAVRTVAATLGASKED